MTSRRWSSRMSASTSGWRENLPSMRWAARSSAVRTLRSGPVCCISGLAWPSRSLRRKSLTAVAEAAWVLGAFALGLGMGALGLGGIARLGCCSSAARARSRSALARSLSRRAICSARRGPACFPGADGDASGKSQNNRGRRQRHRGDCGAGICRRGIANCVRTCCDGEAVKMAANVERELADRGDNAAPVRGAEPFAEYCRDRREGERPRACPCRCWRAAELAGSAPVRGRLPVRSFRAGRRPGQYGRR